MTWHDMTWHDMTWHDMTWHDMTWHDIIQIINVYECDGTNIFMRWKMECSIQRGDSRVEWTFHLSPNENILTIARIKTFIICFISIYQNRLILLFQEQFIKAPFNIKIHTFWRMLYRKHKECNGIKSSTIALAKSAMERFPLH
jgi:hypothetical protein